MRRPPRSAGATGIRVGNMNRVHARDIGISGFNKAGSTGLLFKNDAGAWSEQAEWLGIELLWSPSEAQWYGKLTTNFS